ncbi:MAG: hypothetical protein GY940_29830 [bacterium]|nr:hypothetical protein [bacterium]
MNKKPLSKRNKNIRRKLTFGGFLIFAVLVSLTVYLLTVSDTNVSAQSQADRNLQKKMLDELQKEQRLIEAERQRLNQYELNLKNFELELDKRNNEFLQKEKKLKEQQAEFDKKLEDKSVDRQTIETYESIDPEQAAILIKNLYIKDGPLATMLMRKIAGKKAGKILEAMIPLDREVSTQLAKKTLDYYKPK